MASANHMEVADIMCCASCGTAEVDDTACKSVRYCSVACQREDRAKHKRACKKRMTELRDEILFRQPESSYRGDCPICLSPLPIDPKKCSMQTCCSKNICFGCFYTIGFARAARCKEHARSVGTRYQKRRQQPVFF